MGGIRTFFDCREGGLFPIMENSGVRQKDRIADFKVNEISTRDSWGRSIYK